jgi:hypothetical protein
LQAWNMPENIEVRCDTMHDSETHHYKQIQHNMQSNKINSHCATVPNLMLVIIRKM